MKLYRSVFLLLSLSITFNAKSQADSTFILSKNILTKDLQLKLSGVKYAVMNTTKEEVENVINQRDYQDLFVKLSDYLKGNLGINYFAFTESQRAEVYSNKDLGACDIVEVGFNPGKFIRTLGALGVYKHASLQFRFCDGTKYKVELSDISVDGYSYHPNRFAAAFKRVQGSKVKYNPANRLVQPHLTVYNTREEIDSILAHNKNFVVGEYKSLGLDKNSVAYQIAIIEQNSSYIGLYTAGKVGADWLVGELKAELTPTKSNKIFIAKWYNAAKKPIDCTFIFDDENSFQVKSDGYNDRYVRIK